MTHPDQVPGHPENIPELRADTTLRGNPSFDCITGGHLLMEVYDAETVETDLPKRQPVGSWCLWCGTGAYDGERITDDGPVGFTPIYHLHIPATWHRNPAKGSLPS